MDILQFYEKIEKKIDASADSVRADVKKIGADLVKFKDDCDDEIGKKLDSKWFMWVIGFVIFGIMTASGYAATGYIIAGQANHKIDLHTAHK